MPTEPPAEPSQGLSPERFARLASYFPTESERTGEGTVSTRLQIRDALLGATGALRMGAVAYAVDVATGQAMGIAALAGDRWIVTTDMDIRLLRPVGSGHLQVDAEVVRAGETTVVSTFTLLDGGGQVVGGGTATGRPFPFDFDRSLLGMRVGEKRGWAATTPASPEAFEANFGIRVAEGGGVRLGIEDWMRNPWGILHGGITSCLADLSAAAAGSQALGRPAAVTGATIRFLAPGRTGPVAAAPAVQGCTGDQALVEVRVSDAGSAGRLMAVASTTVG